MSGITVLRKIQIGKESALGTKVDATSIWRGEGVLEDLSKPKLGKEQVGNYGSAGRIYVPNAGGRIKMTQEASFEQLLHVFAAGVDGSITGVKDGAGSGYVWTYALPTTAAKTPATYTIEAGNNEQEREMGGAFVEEFTLKGGVDDPVMLEAVWRGQQVANGTYTSALAPVAVSTLLFNKTSIYLDLVSGTLGNTVKASTLVDLELKVRTGFQALDAANGQLYYAAIKQVEPVITFGATFEHDAVSELMYTQWLAGTGALVRLKFIGPALTSPATESTKRLTIDGAVKWLDVKPLSTKNGDDQLKVEGQFYFEPTPTPDLFCNIVLVNELAAIP